MPLEIERKFLLKNAPKEYVKKADLILEISQFYFKNPKTNIFERVRIAKEVSKRGTIKSITYYHTVKFKIAAGVNDENEKKITKEQAIQLIKPNKDELTCVEKTRHIKKRPKAKWELDIFKTVRIVMLEIETKRQRQKIVLSKEFIDELLLEVTPFKEFSNRSLSKKVNYNYFLSKL